MKRLGELAIHRGIPLIVGYVVMHYWGEDSRAREWIVFGLATGVTHSILLAYDLAATSG